MNIYFQGEYSGRQCCIRIIDDSNLVIIGRNLEYRWTVSVVWYQGDAIEMKIFTFKN